MKASVYGVTRRRIKTHQVTSTSVEVRMKLRNEACKILEDKHIHVYIYISMYIYIHLDFQMTPGHKTQYSRFLVDQPFENP